MERQEHTCERIRALDGTSFRFEHKGDDLFMNGMPAGVQARRGGTVALVTEHKTVQVSAANFWEVVYDEVLPSKLLADVILAQLYEVRERLKGIAAWQQERG